MARAAWPFQPQVLNETMSPMLLKPFIFLLSFLKSRAERGEELLELVGFPF